MHVYYSPTVYSGYYESLWRSYYLVFRGSKIFLVAICDSETFTRDVSWIQVAVHEQVAKAEIQKYISNHVSF